MTSMTIAIGRADEDPDRDRPGDEDPDRGAEDPDQQEFDRRASPATSAGSWRSARHGSRERRCSQDTHRRADPGPLRDHPLRPRADFVGFSEPGRGSGACSSRICDGCGSVRNIRSNPSAGDVILASDIARSVSGPFLGRLRVARRSRAWARCSQPAPTRAAVCAPGCGFPGAGVVAFGLVEVTIAVVRCARSAGAPRSRSRRCYLVLTVFAVALLVRAPTTPCACLGSSGAPVSRAHVVDQRRRRGHRDRGGVGRSPFAQFSGRWFAAAVFAGARRVLREARRARARGAPAARRPRARRVAS